MITIPQIRARQAQLAVLLNAADVRSAAIVKTLTEANRATTPDEAAEVAKLAEEKSALNSEKRANDVTLADLEAAEAAEGRSSIVPTEADREAAAAAVRAAAPVKVKAEPLTYNKWDHRTSYIADLVAAKGLSSQAPDAALARLERHAAEMRAEGPKTEARMWDRSGRELRDANGQEMDVRYEQEKRDLTRVDGAGGYFVPPVWMINDYIDLARAGRVTANLMNAMPLPPNTDSINIPKVTTGTATAIQTADNAAVNEVDLVDTSVSAGVKTIAGQQDMALQLLEQSPISFDQIILQDLARDYATKLDVQVISGSNASGQVLGIRTVASVPTTTYTDGSPTVPEMYPKLASAWSTVSTTRFLPPEAIVMHPRRWAWIMAALDSNNKPFVVLPGVTPTNLPYQFAANAAEGYVGATTFGPVYVDPNIPTTVGAGTEDVILFLRPTDMYLWEGSIRTRILTEVLSGNLTVRVQLYNYVAFLPQRRVESINIVTGTGLIAPTF